MSLDTLHPWDDAFGADPPRQKQLRVSDALQQQFFGRALRVLRTRMQVSQDALGVIVGLSADDHARIEAGLLAPSLWRAIDLATFFETTVEVMCGRGTLPASTAAADEDDEADLA